jgi:outer membrane protein OmpA-like peptidoglycan-associated protein
MEKLLTRLSVMALVVFLPQVVFADSHVGDGGTVWGNSGATGMPVEDSDGSGYWWWPDTPGSNDDDSEVWGNAGTIYSEYVAPTPAKPAPVAAPKVERQVPVLSSILFGFDDSTLSAAGESAVRDVASELKKNRGDTLVIEGHTCDVNNSGDSDYNVKLGQRRADAVRAVLVKNGISGSRLSAKSLGERKPAVANTSSANRAKNRRVVFVYSIAN